MSGIERRKNEQIRCTMSGELLASAQISETGVVSSVCFGPLSLTNAARFRAVEQWAGLVAAEIDAAAAGEG